MAFLKEIKQNTPAWVSWRKNKIGASDFCYQVNQLLKNLYSYNFLEVLKKLKQYKNKDIKDNWRMMFGRDAEPKIRDYINKNFHDLTWGEEIEDACFECDDNKSIIASLDGYSFNNNTIFEIKTTHVELERYQSMVENYLPQLIHQYYTAFGDSDIGNNVLFMYYKSNIRHFELIKNNNSFSLINREIKLSYKDWLELNHGLLLFLNDKAEGINTLKIEQIIGKM